MTQRGYFGIGVYHPKFEVNIGTLWRSATLYGASFIFTIGPRYKKQASDTHITYKHIPLWTFTSYQEFHDHIPYDAQVFCVELSEQAECLSGFTHPERAVYLLGAEDHGLPKRVLEGKRVIQVPTVESFSMNVAVAGSLVMYDRYVKGLVG